MWRNFDCQRTCRTHERIDLCRFSPIFAKLGPVTVNSHTVKIRVDFADPDALKSAVIAMGGNWLGQGSHKLYRGKVVGVGFQLAGWQFPCVLDAAGELHYDDYGGLWGNAADLERLRTEYAVGQIETAARELGWLTERTADGLTVYNPSGGILTYARGEIETSGFQGSGCHEARLALGLDRLGLVAGEAVNKQEYSAVAAQVQLPA